MWNNTVPCLVRMRFAASLKDWVDIWARGIAAHPEDWHMLQPIFLEDLDVERLKGVPEELRAQAATSR